MIRRAILTGAVFLSAFAPVTVIACPPDSPAAILDCLSLAYAARDIDAYEQLLASDYVFRSGTKIMSREIDRNVTHRLFEDVTSLSLTFGSPGTIAVTEDPLVWRLNGVPLTLVVVAEEGTSYTVSHELDYMLVEGDARSGFRILELADEKN